MDLLKAQIESGQECRQRSFKDRPSRIETTLSGRHVGRETKCGEGKAGGVATFGSLQEQ